MLLEDKQDMIALLTGVKSSKKNYYTELKQTVTQLRKKNMQLEIMNEIMKSIKIDMSLDDILKNMIHKLNVLVPFDRLGLLLFQNERLTLTNVYPNHSHILEIGSIVPNENSLYWSSLSTRQIILKRLQDAADYDFYEKTYLTALHLKTILVLPIYSKNKKIAVLSIGRNSETEWEIDDLAFLEQLTTHLAVSIENTQLYHEVLRAKQEWEDTFKAVEDMIIVFDQDGHILRYNDSVQAFFHCQEQSIDFMLEKACQTLVMETFYQGKPGYKEIYFEEQTTCELHTYPVHNHKQEVYAVIAYMKDVTEKRKLEVHLLHSGKLAAIGEMAAGVAHELNSPLTAILGNSQLLLRNTASDSPSYTLLSDIKNCGVRCKQIIKSLLTFSRQDTYTFSSCSLNEAIEQVLNLLKYQIEDQQIKIQTLLSDYLPMIEASQPQIEQIIINLLLNAKDALTVAEKKEIIIETSLQPNEVHLSVTDNGIGIEENRLSEIFHPFHTTKESEKGTGLGLSVSIGIAKAHGGTIDVISTLNKGSTFTLKLPLQRDPINP